MKPGTCHMQNCFIKMIAKWHLLKDERGQDLVEYGLAIATVAFAMTAGMTTLAGALNTAFSAMGAAVISAIAQFAPK